MNIDIGGGRTNVSVFSFGHQIVWDILSVGGDRFDDAISDYLRKKHNPVSYTHLERGNV